MTNQSHTELAARTFYELTEAERVSAITAFKQAHGSMAELNFAPDRAWIEGFAYAAALESPERVALTDEQIDALVTEYRGRVYPQDMYPRFERSLTRAAIAEFCRLNGIGTSATKEGV